jgi:hypothetical protein
LPHVPQLFGSSVVSVQVPPPPNAEQTVAAPAVHSHLPALHAEPAAQRAPHMLQLSGSVMRSTQRPLHIVAPALHLQAPASHVSPDVQRVPHAPQLSGSVIVSEHVAPRPMPQIFLPVGHAHAVAPPVVMHD